ncbi:MAG: hypothetical protein K1X36_01400 [Pyrinomonadaceae bacterium]|nr:hypothetical protein [Pyrinomonadaceae bacterium]
MSSVQPSNSSPGSRYRDRKVPSTENDLLPRRAAVLIALFLFLSTTSNIFAFIYFEPTQLTPTFSGTSSPPCPTVSIPALSAVQNTVVTVPINTSDISGLDVISFDASISYDPSVISSVSVVTTGTISSSMNVTVNSLTPGTILISAYTPNPIAGVGTLIKLNFNAIGPIGSSSPLTINSFTYNEGDPCSATANGSVTIVDCIGVSFQTGQTAVKNASITIPINTTLLTGRNAISFDAIVNYDPSIISEISVTNAGTISSSMIITVNDLTPGTLIISAYGPDPLVGSGALININYNAVGPIGSSSPLSLTSFTFNEGTPCSITNNGDVTIVSGTVSGIVSYANSIAFKPVPNTVLNAVGSVNAATNSAFLTGAYSFGGFGPGSYVVTPAKSSDVYAITGFDSALIAQHVVSLISLNSVQLLAADVSGNNIVTGFDAALIAQWVVLIPNLGSTGTWKFVPPSRSYVEMAPDQTGENYSAILMGEVSGNWVPPTSFATLAPMASRSEAPNVTINVTAPAVNKMIGSSFSVPVTVSDTTGAGIISWQFDLFYNPAIITPQVSPIDTAGTLSSGFAVTVNSLTPGLLKVVLFGSTPISGSGTLFNFRFTAVGANGQTSPLTWQNFMFNEGNPSNIVTNGSVRLIAGPTASGVTIDGRIIDPSGRPVRNALVRLDGDLAFQRFARTNPFGYFGFGDIPAGAAYVISAESKQFTVLPRVISVNDSVTGIELVAEGN